MAEPEKHDPGSKRAPSLLYNTLSYIGIFVAVCSLFAIFLLVFIDYIGRWDHPYLGILTYLILPGGVWLGLLLVGIGAWRERSHRRHMAAGRVAEFPRLDFNRPRHRHIFVAVVIGAFFLLVLTAFGSYRAYHVTESVGFCGVVCHTVMKPEYTAYHHSPHARVLCTECHIGPGATWFARSKVSGLYQVYATLADIYDRPIPTPVKNLRPAQETCEQCHWPEKFYGAVELLQHHFLPDEGNTPWTIRMLIKVGGANPAHGPVGGIHWHMNVGNTIEYIPKDEKRQVIPWVRLTDRQGRVIVYESKRKKLTPEQIQAGPVRRMDCIDCHNRPTHLFFSPNEALNAALWMGRIDSSIPYIKLNAAKALVQDVATEEQGLQKIAETLKGEYANYQEAEKIRQAIAETQRVFQDNFFPVMKTDWRVRPNNIGHLEWPGCFRCHDGNHVSADGKTISNECEDCHTIVAQGAGLKPESVSLEGLEFEHPGPKIPKKIMCNLCHTGMPRKLGKR
jgi:hypothetical protein